jgi:hypothetical protein
MYDKVDEGDHQNSGGGENDGDRWERCMQYLDSEQCLSAKRRLCNSVIQTRQRRDKLHTLGARIAEHKIECFTVDFFTETDQPMSCYTEATALDEDDT